MNSFCPHYDFNQSCPPPFQTQLIIYLSKYLDKSTKERSLISFTSDLCWQKNVFQYWTCLFPVLPDTCENGISSCCCCVC